MEEMRAKESRQNICRRMQQAKNERQSKTPLTTHTPSACSSATDFFEANIQRIEHFVLAHFKFELLFEFE